MAVGKTTVGRALAETVGCRHIDLDDEVAIRAGRTVQDIINSDGEEVFRLVEQRVLLDVIDEVKLYAEDNKPVKGMVVISTGGGTPCFADNMDVMRSAGCVVWLRMSVDGVAERLRVNRKERPLLANVDDGHVCCVVGRHIAMRRMFYEKAHLTLDVDRLSVRDIVGVIEEKLGL